MVMDVLHSVLVFPGSVVVSEGWCVSGRPLAWVLMSFGADISSRTMLMLNISHKRGVGCGVDGTEVHRKCRIMWVMDVLHIALKDFCVIGISPRVMLMSSILSAAFG